MAGDSGGYEPGCATVIEIFRQWKTPAAVQAFLDDIPYSSDPFGRCPRRVLADRVANCFDGALLAAAALRVQGHPPLMVDMRAVHDDDHILAIFRRNGCLGAVAKSNFVGLRYREPVYRTLRELIMTYFDQYYNVDGERTLRGYSAPLNLGAFDHLDWVNNDDAVDVIGGRLDTAHHFALLTPAMEGALCPMDERSRQAGMLGINEAGLYRPIKN